MPPQLRGQFIILIVADDEPILKTARQHLAEGQYEFIDARGADQCQAAFAQYPDLVLFHDAITTLDPFAHCFNFKADHPQVPVLFISDNEEQALAAGADDVIESTLPPLLLKRRARNLLSRRSAHLAAQSMEQDNVIKLLLDPKSGSIIDANDFACIFYGYTYTDLCQLTIAQLDAQPERQMMLQVMQAAENNSTYFVFKHVLATGEVREVEMYSYPLSWDDRRLMFIICHDVSSRLQTENALRDSEERYRTLVETTSDLIFVIAPDARFTYLSPAFEASFGWAAHDWIGKSFIPLIHYKDLDRAIQLFERAIKGETRRAVEMRFNTVNRKPGIGEFIFQPQLQNGRIIGVWGTMRDITARRQAEDNAHEQRELAEALRDTATALNSTLDLNELFDCILAQLDRVVHSDSANILLIERGRTQMVASRGYAERGIYDEVMALSHDVRQTRNYHWMLTTGKPLAIPDVSQYTGWVKSKATNWIKSYVSAPIRVDGEVIGFLNVDSDTVNTFSSQDADNLQLFADQAAIAIRNARLYSALRQTANELEQRVADRTRELENERAQLRAILEAMSEGVIFDEKFRIRYTNQAMTDMVGLSPAKWQEYRTVFVTEDDANFDTFLKEMYATVSKRSPWLGERRLRRPDGAEFDVSMSVTPVIDPSGEVTGAVTVVRDISHEKALHEQKARFVAHASHELRTPLTNLKTRLYLMRKQPDQMGHHIQVLEAVTERMRHLVENLLDMSRFERGTISLDRRPARLQTLIHELVQLQQPEAENKQISLEAQLPEEAIVISMDSERIIQVLTNLVTNALNYTPPGGVVQVRVPDPARDKAVHIYVEDTGIGIAPEHLNNIFQPFYRINGKIKGTGLGLSISKEIAELHNGKLTVHSKPGVGSTFCLHLPLEVESTAHHLQEDDNAVHSA